MSKKSPLLIYHIEGDVTTCFDCPEDKKKPAAYVVHYNVSFADEEDKEKSKGVKRKGMERFLCRECYRANWRDNPMRVIQGQSDFTFLPIVEWKRLSYQYK